MGNCLSSIAEEYGKPSGMLKRDLLQTELSDEILAARIAQHDIAALEVIYDRFASRVFTLAAILSDSAEAERIVLQVFSRLWFEANQFNFHGGTFQDWFLSLTRAHILHRLVSNRGQTAQDRVDAINRWLSETANQTRKSREEFHKPGFSSPIWQALHDLTIEQRCVIVLASYGGYKQKEIAQLLNLPLNIVEQHIKQGLPRLRDIVMSEPVLERVL
jgi:RNA polymerase sigma factor (sigma-70 family)